MTKKPLKFVVVGDGGCGKTSLIMVQAGGEFTDNYIPTAFDDYAIEALINGKTVCFSFSFWCLLEKHKNRNRNRRMKF